ncbi:MAG: HD domain-containing protein [Acidobacteriota bacterium]|nr:HD domain-containing protein [Acidobacteriota bacterium]
MPRSNDIDALVLRLAPELPGTALLAVGGYGRRDLFPCSDIDLLLVSEQPPGPAFAAFLRVLWDSGLRVSQSVHSVADCLTLHEGNLEFTLSLMDRRFLAGDPAIWNEVDSGFGRMFRRRRNEIALATTRLTRDRHACAQNTIYHLEPNVKDGPGGLRDLHILEWFQASHHLEKPVKTLSGLRRGLHEIFGRDQNILTFEAQDRLGASPDEVMASYFRAARKVQRSINRWMDAEESRASPLFARLRDRSSALSTPEFSVVHGQIYLRHAAPPEDLSVFEFVARHGLRLSADAGRRIHDSTVHPVCEWRALATILALPHAGLALREMHETGVLGRIFPGWASIEGLVVRDFYHQYTVDEHTLVAVETALQLRTGPPGLFPDLAREAPDYPLLLTALLLHDAGKGKGAESHAEVSVESALPVLTELAMPADDRELVLFLIGAHLDMSRTMTTRDLTDPQTARTMAARAGTLERLKLLTLLTYADISAVNPRALTPWRTTLLWQLYSVAAAEISATREPAQMAAPSAAQPQAGVTLEHANGVWTLTLSTPDRPFLFASVAGALSSFGMDILRAEAYSPHHLATDKFTFSDPTRTLELNPGEASVLTATVERAAAGLEDIPKLLKRRSRPLPHTPHLDIAFDSETSQAATILTIVGADRPGLLYHLAFAISSEGCNIETVLINTEGRRAIDVFYVTASGLKLSEERQEQLAARIRSEG